MSVVAPSRALSAAILLGACFGESQQHASVRNQTSVSVSLEYVQEDGDRYVALDRPVEPGSTDTLFKPFPLEFDRQVDGCLQGTFVAVAADGHEVASVTGLCDGGHWDITE